jgi:hypothetical protein
MKSKYLINILLIFLVILVIALKQKGIIQGTLNNHLTSQIISDKDWRYWDILNKQIEKITPLPYADSTHEKKMEVRLTIPVLYKIFYFIKPATRVWNLYLIEILLFIISSFIIFLNFDRFSLFFLPKIAFYLTFFGTIFFSDVWPMADPVALSFGIFLFFTNNKLANNIFTTIGMFTDERFIFFILLKNLLDLDFNWTSIKIFVTNIVCMIIPYLILRLYLTLFFDLKPFWKIENDISLFYFIRKIDLITYSYALFSLFKGWWIFLFLYVINSEVIFRKKLIIICYILLGIFGSLLVADHSRSLNYIYLILFIPLFDRTFTLDKGWYLFIFIINFICPDYDFHTPAIFLGFSQFTWMMFKQFGYFNYIITIIKLLWIKIGI